MLIYVYRMLEIVDVVCILLQFRFLASVQLPKQSNENNVLDQLPPIAFDRIPKKHPFNDAKGYVLNNHALEPVPT